MAELFSEDDATYARQPSEHVYAIVRLDHFIESQEESFTVKEIVRTQDIAEAEVRRLNELNADKEYTYFWQVTRLFPAGSSSGNRKDEDGLK